MSPTGLFSNMTLLTHMLQSLTELFSNMTLLTHMLQNLLKKLEAVPCVMMPQLLLLQITICFGQCSRFWTAFFSAET